MNNSELVNINNYKTAPAFLRKPEKIDLRLGSHGKTWAGSLYDISGCVTKPNLVTLTTRVPDPTEQTAHCRSPHTKHVTQNPKYHYPFRGRRTMGLHAATHIVMAFNWSSISDVFRRFPVESRPTHQLLYFVLTWFILILSTRVEASGELDAPAALPFGKSLL